MFALGVILFILYTGYPPFGSSKDSDPYFKTFTENNDKFWTVHSRGKPQGYYSEEFINLINQLLCPEATRLTVEEAMNHTWTLGTVDSLNQMSAKVGSLLL